MPKIGNLSIFGFNALLEATGKQPRKPLDILELEAGSLKAAIAKIDARRVEWNQAANEILTSIGISFERWQKVVAAIEGGQDPQLQPEESEKLVSRGLLVRTYRLGGSTR